MSDRLKNNTSASCDLSILIVSYNTKLLTLNCLESIFKQNHADYTFEIIVVDNASGDGSALAVKSQFPTVKLFEMQTNLGFARANNFAAEQAKGDWILLLNPDTVVLDAAIDRLFEVARAHRTGQVFGGRTLFANGSLNPTSCWARSTIWSTFCFAFGLTALSGKVGVFGREDLAGWKRDTERFVDILSGCFLLLRRNLFQTVGGFDPQFKMYGEDFDLCLRIGSSGGKCVYSPSATILHYGGASETVKSDQIVRQMRAKIQLMRKHWNWFELLVGTFLLKIRVFTRAAGFGLLGYFASKYRVRSVAWSQSWYRRREWLSADLIESGPNAH